MGPAIHKKRPATAQGGPPQKKLKAKTKAIPKETEPMPKKKRNLPVTVQAANLEDSASEGDNEPSSNEVEDDVMEVDDSIQRTKDPNASRESHAAQKVLANQRKAAKPHSTLLERAKPLWSLARQIDIPKAERQKHIDDLMKVVRGKVQDVVFKHDASRIIQTLVKYGGQKERDEIATELKGRYKELAQNKYAKFLVTKLIRYSPTRRSDILSEFHTHVIRLLLHRESSSILADAFELYASSSERNLLLRDFYGKEVLLFKEGQDGKGGLAAILGGVDTERRKRVLAALKDNLINIFNNPEKGAVTHAIVHRALWEYLTECNKLPEGEAEKAWREMFENCQELVADMVHTRDGSRVVREFLARGAAKDRKQVIKVIKPHIERMCQDEEAQLVLFTALDVIDDTKLLAKSLVAEIVSHAPSLYSSIHGRRSLLYLIVPRSTKHFTPAMSKLLAETDEIRTKTSKKDPEMRADEVRKAASEGLIALVRDKGGEMIRDPGGSLALLDIMLSAEGDKSAATQTVFEPLTNPYPSESHIIDNAPASRVYKTLLQGGHYSQSLSRVVRSTSFSSSSFASAFITKVGKENTEKFALGGGTFVVAELCERVREEGSDGEKETIKSWLAVDVRKQLETEKCRGWEVLTEKIKRLD